MFIYVVTWVQCLFPLLGFDDVKVSPQMTRYVKGTV